LWEIAKKIIAGKFSKKYIVGLKGDYSLMIINIKRGMGGWI
jgi:hypothetical protein